MIKLTAENLDTEYKSAKAKRDSHLEDFDHRIERLVGPGAHRVAPNDQSTVNRQGAYMAVTLPRLVQNNPRASINARRRGRSSGNSDHTLDQQAAATKIFLDAWVKSVDLASEHAKIGTDYLMYWGATLMTREKHPGMSTMRGADTYLPKLERIPLYRIFIDPLCDDWRKARYIGHVWNADIDDLKAFAEENEDEGWEKAAIKTLVASAGMDDLGDRNEEDNTDREEVVCADFWFPEHQPDKELGPEEGFNGAIVTIAISSGNKKSIIIRKPRPYFGPPRGPYEIYGTYSEYKTPYPVSPLTLSTGQEELLRSMVGEANKGARSYRKVVLIPGGTKAKHAAELAAIGKDLIIEVPGMAQDAKPVEIELGGVTDQQLRNVAYAERQADLITGMDQAQQGEVTGVGTATEHAIAESSSQTRNGYVIDRFRDGVRKNMERAAWYSWYDDEIAIPVGPDEEDTQEFEVPWIQGGSGDLDPLAFDLLEIDIEAMSMERVTEELQKRRVMQAFEVMTQVIPLMRNFPEVNWRRMISMIGDALNLPDMGSLVDMDMLSQLTGVPSNTTPSASQGDVAGGERREVAGRMTGGAMSAVAGGVA